MADIMFFPIGTFSGSFRFYQANSLGFIGMFKKAVKKIINRAGLDLHRLNPSSNPAFQLLKSLNRFEADLVLDVGANIGQFASELRSVGYKGNIVSFEPLSSAPSLTLLP